MATLTEKQRDKLPDSKFGLPEEHKYPMPDKSHARNAKARASQQEEKGTITAKEKAKIDRKADRILDTVGLAMAARPAHAGRAVRVSGGGRTMAAPSPAEGATDGRRRPLRTDQRPVRRGGAPLASMPATGRG